MAALTADPATRPRATDTLWEQPSLHERRSRDVSVRSHGVPVAAAPLLQKPWLSWERLEPRCFCQMWKSIATEVAPTEAAPTFLRRAVAKQTGAKKAARQSARYVLFDESGAAAT